MVHIMNITYGINAIKNHLPLLCICNGEIVKEIKYFDNLLFFLFLYFVFRKPYFSINVSNVYLHYVPREANKIFKFTRISYNC